MTPSDKCIIVKLWNYPNWGDQINKELAWFITHQPPMLINANINCPQENYLIVGSTLQYCDKNTIVWGAGFLRATDIFEFGNPKRICAVRGKLSRKKLLDLGVDCPEVYGDPVLLLSKFYNSPRHKKYDLGIVVHWRDEFHELAKFKETNRIVKIPHNIGAYKFINLITSCNKIASSSLHGLICANAYGIPAMHIKFFNQEQFKFADYFSSVNVDYKDPLPFENIKQLLDNFSPYKPEINTEDLWKHCPIRQ